MYLHILIAYFVLNLVIGLALHIHNYRHTSEPPRAMEVVMYFVVFLLIGTPLFLLTRLVQADRGHF